MSAGSGGKATQEVHSFELTGGALCLDFANTVDRRPTSEPRELLESFSDLLEWSLQAGALRDTDFRRLRKQARGARSREAAVLVRARRLREELFVLFSAAARHEQLPRKSLDLLNKNLAGTLARLRLGPVDDGIAWLWVEEYPLDRMLWPIVRSAADLLTSGDLGRVRECAGDDCAWLFLDRSRNRSRRWCDMTVCGNRSKVRRHRSRSA